jgi:thiaminase/transcriptional activator TenA
MRALADGSLDASLFRGYIVQDAFFLRAFAKAYALALARERA